LLLQAAFTERGGSTWGRGNALASGKEGGQECFEEDLPICKVIEWPLGGGGSRSSGRRAAEHLVMYFRQFYTVHPPAPDQEAVIMQLLNICTFLFFIAQTAFPTLNI
jgi:hypothetical protein